MPPGSGESDGGISDTTLYPPFGSKADFLTGLTQCLEQEGGRKDRLYEIVYRLSNTDTDDWADPTARHDA